jgi:tetratricopeptide (TPR) repeat protein
LEVILMNEPVSPLSVPRCRRRYVALAVLLLGLAATAGFAWKWWFRPAPIGPPALDSAGVDPMVWRAIEAAREAVFREPESDRAWGRLGMVLLAHQLRDEAGVCLARAEQLNSRDVRWPYYQAIAVRRSDPEAAIAHLRRVAAADGEEMEAPRLLLGELLVEGGRLDEAETLFRNVLRRDPHNSRAYVGLAHVAFERDDMSACLAHLREASENPCTRKAAHMFLAEVQQRRGDRAAAEESLRQAQQLPDDAPWPDPLAEPIRELVVGHLEVVTHAAALLQQDEAAQAIPLLQQAIDDYPESNWARILLGRAWLRVRNLTEAERILRSAVERAPDAVEAHFYMGVVLFEREEIEAAVPFFRKAVELKPDYALAWYNLGHCLKRRGDRAEALAAFRAAVACKPQFAQAHTNLGELLADEGRLDEAGEHLRRASRLAPQDTRARQLLESVQKRTAIREQQR